MLKKVIGLIIITMGILFLLSNLDIISMEEVRPILWPVALMVVGIVGIYEKKKLDFFFSLFVLIGALYFLSAINIINEETIKLLIGPLIIIGIGISFFFKCHKTTTKIDNKKYIAVFSGVEDKNESDSYSDSEILAIFGGVEIDYREIKFKGDKAYINVTAIFGGVTILVPDNIKIIASGIPIFGGCEVTAKSDNTSNKELIVNYTVVFGGVEIKN